MTGLEGVELLGVTDKRFWDIDGRNNHPHPHPPPPASPPPLFFPSTANYSEEKKKLGDMYATGLAPLRGIQWNVTYSCKFTGRRWVWRVEITMVCVSMCIPGLHIWWLWRISCLSVCNLHKGERSDKGFLFSEPGKKCWNGLYWSPARGVKTITMN